MKNLTLKILEGSGSFLRHCPLFLNLRKSKVTFVKKKNSRKVKNSPDIYKKLPNP
jgi:hypothetical protein